MLKRADLNSPDGYNKLTVSELRSPKAIRSNGWKIKQK
jgi:hypothetical protein